MEDEKDLCLIKLFATIKAVAENTNFTYSETTLQLDEQIQNEFKEKFPNFDWVYDEETGVLTAIPIVTMFPIDIIVCRKEDKDES